MLQKEKKRILEKRKLDLRSQEWHMQKTYLQYKPALVSLKFSIFLLA